MYHGNKEHRLLLQEIAHRVMLEKGLLPDFPPEVSDQLSSITQSNHQQNPGIRDLRNLLWSSIDNDSSKDLDQLTVAAALPDGTIKLMVAVADVDYLVKPHTAIDNYAQHNTTSVYTAAEIFPMFPPELSNDITSLNPQTERIALVIEMELSEAGVIQKWDVYQALVRSHAKLAYNSLAEWLEGNAPVPEKVKQVQGLKENLLLQDKAAQKLRTVRHAHGALNLETTEVTSVFSGDELVSLELETRNRAKELIEDFMIAANVSCAWFLEAKKFPSLRRVVHVPRRWDRIREIAHELGTTLPPEPDSQALEQFLIARRAADPERFPDLSLSVIKMLGAGEYMVDSTAPNRRYPDLITHRLLKAALAGKPVPYETAELEALATQCNKGEDAANKVERQVGKSAAALILEHKIGNVFEGFVTGAAEKGTWVRILHPPVEGRIIEGEKGLDIGHKVQVRLLSTDVEQGLLDFARAD
jgi:VacB/RNase II family 3'-5' exoribonuclease